MKYILAFLSLITLSSFNANFTAAYDQKVNDAYSEYVLETDSQGEYGLQLVKGSVNGEIRYGFSFYSENSGDYYVRVLYNNKYYQLPTDSRGDIQAVALNLKAGDVFSIVVFRSRTGLAEPFGKYKNLKVMSEGEFELLEGKVSGHGQGTELSKLTTKIVFTAEHWFYIATFLIIITCSITVFIYYKRRQGLFNKEVR
ncbi:MAG: hypothetical protein PHX62_05650, partial [Bacilli bacterium]|nr:hypothetical protein [Bacilli bacterium]